MYTTVTSKGQVTLPKALRDKLDLSAGDRIEFVLGNDGSVRLVVKHASINRLKGMLPKPRQPIALEDMERLSKRAPGSRDRLRHQCPGAIPDPG